MGSNTIETLTVIEGFGYNIDDINTLNSIMNNFNPPDDKTHAIEVFFGLLESGLIERREK
jgi:hypothetical protein